jgi:two-component system phosphate regulon response regulator PhoB
VDDEPYIGRIVRMQFERGPFRVGVAYDGAGALEYLRENADVDCVLVDLQMPGMSGLDLLEHLRGGAIGANVPVLVVTAAGAQSQVERARALGAGIVTKPFSPKKLYGQVTELLDTPASPPEAG